MTDLAAIRERDRLAMEAESLPDLAQRAIEDRHVLLAEYDRLLRVLEAARLVVADGPEVRITGHHNAEFDLDAAIAAYDEADQ